MCDTLHLDHPPTNTHKNKPLTLTHTSTNHTHTHTHKNKPLTLHAMLAVTQKPMLRAVEPEWSVLSRSELANTVKTNKKLVLISTMKP